MNIIHCPIRSFAIILAGFAALFTLPGCTTVQVTEDTIAQFRFGELQAVVPANFQETADATLRSLEDQGLFLTGDDRKVIEAVISARDRTDTGVTIKIKEIAVDRTSVKIRYGLSGDAARSQLLYRAIEERL